MGYIASQFIRKAGRRDGVRSIALLLAAVMVVSACAGSSSSSGPDLVETTIRAGIMVPYEQAILPDGYQTGHLTPDQHDQLRSRILTAYSGSFTGTLLTSDLNDMLSWADRIATKPTTRNLVARMEKFAIESKAIKGDRADVVGSYTVYTVASGIGPDGHETADGGRVSLTFTCELISSGQSWRLSQYSDQLTQYQPDPSAHKS